MKFRIILNSGQNLDVEPSDATKSMIGLLNWSTTQLGDPILSFKGGAVRSSQVAAILELEINEAINELTPFDYMDMEGDE